ncbi:site-specific integrase [Candidatus Bathyarchaeota archaeon]|nr:site-specific integrase [Candidatus Bathyarchaeota archaeon]
MIERVKTIAPAIVRQRNLTIDELKSLNLPLIFQGDLVIFEKSLNLRKLQTPIAIELQKILEAKEKGLVDYIIRSCLNERSSVIPYIFDNETMLKLARHFLRHCSGSNKSCMLYAVNVKRYAQWLGYSPDQIIQDVKPVGAVPDPIKVQNHCGFLNDYLAEIQDSGLKPNAVSNLIKAVKTFYRVNGVKKIELDEPLSRKVTYKDRAPKPEEIVTMLDMAPTRECFIITALATGGFREGTFAKLKYRHVKEDLEAGIIPIHVHVEAAITKGKYHDYDTFLNAEASYFLKLYMQERRLGTPGMPPEQITDDSPLIRNSHIANRVHGVTEKTIRLIVHNLAVKAKATQKLPDSWMYSVRTHSIRKFFKKLMQLAKVEPDIIEYMMGHTIDTYSDIQNFGTETLRQIYIAAAIMIRVNVKTNKIDQLKLILKSWGLNPEEILTKDALMRGNQTETSEQVETRQMSVLSLELKEAIKKEVLEK